MDIILENYLIIVLVGLFFVFALIGYLIDLLKNNNSQKNDGITNITPIEITKIEKNDNANIEITSTTIQKEEKNNADELLENYDKEIQ